MICCTEWRRLSPSARMPRQAERGGGSDTRNTRHPVGQCHRDQHPRLARQHPGQPGIVCSAAPGRPANDGHGACDREPPVIALAHAGRQRWRGGQRAADVHARGERHLLHLGAGQGDGVGTYTLTVADDAGNPESGCPNCLPGPGPDGMLKPDLSWFSTLRVIGGGTARGSSYATPLVSGLAAHTFANLKEPTPDLVRALLINLAEQEAHKARLGWLAGWPSWRIRPAGRGVGGWSAPSGRRSR